MLQRLREGGHAADRALVAVRRALPPELAREVWAAAVDGGTLSLICESPAWATRLRYARDGLLGPVAAELGTPLARVVVKVRPRPRPAGP